MGSDPPDAMGPGEDKTPLSFRGRRLPPWVELHLVVLPPGCTHPFYPDDWRGALIVVERGAIELELRSGRRRACSQGYIGTLSGLSLRALHNNADRTAVITAVSRCRHAHSQPAPGTSTETASNCPLGGPEPGAPS